ncbi:uncharacterized protein LOC106133899 [Amyelois transitella]|uniref:uncharacterized protein LOC106133899 n=1 Tax=Amyelois transitella TaxID=680683 RepID=UPI00067BA5B8|nr:uncharacterized protein LOC106133899 [Amyelois transitella]
MGPKKTATTDENFWRTCIENTSLNDDNWKAIVLVIESAGSDQDRIYLNKFENYAAEEKRFVIKNICKTETIFMINQLGGEKKVKDDNLRVFEEGQSYLKDKKEIPPEIQALIIKHLILKMKEEYLFIKRQRLEVKVGMRRESETMIDRTEVRGTVNVPPPEPAEPPPPPSKGKKNQKQEPVELPPEPAEGKKYNTMLRVRGEEWRDKVYVDDYPTDGPNLYIAVTGFMEPSLAGCLIKIGVPLTAIVQVRIDPATIRIPSSLLRPTKRGQSQTEMLAEQSLKFWEDLQQLRIHKDSADDYKKTAFIVFTPPYSDTDNLCGNPEVVYDELCYLMYDIQDLTRQHLHYLDNMDIIKIASEETANKERYFSYYDQLLMDVPLECVTVYSLLDTVLRTVCQMENMEEKSTITSLSTALTLNQIRKSGEDYKIERAENLVQDVFTKLCITEADKKMYRSTYGEEYEEHKDPVVINFGDFAKNSTFHLGNINLDNIVWHTLLGMPINNLWASQPKLTEEQEAKSNFHINVLLSCFERPDVENTELNRLIHILACRKLYNNRSSLKKHHLPSSTILDFKKVYLKRSVLAEPLQTRSSLMRTSSTASPSFPPMTKSEDASNNINSYEIEDRRIKFLFECPDLSELVTASEIADGKFIDHMIDDYEFFDEFTGVSAFQIILDAFNTFNCVDYKYCEVTDSIVLMFYNSCDNDGIAREEWRCHLPTPLCLQDFFDFVLEEHYDWIQKEERIYDEKMAVIAQSENIELIDPKAAKSCIENTDIEMELLMEGSLKYQAIAEIEESSPEFTESKITSKKTTASPSTTDMSRSAKKAKPTASTPRNIIPQTPSGPPRKPFSGYDLSDRRVEVFGKDVTYFSKDGTRVSSFYTLIIPINVESILLSVKPGKGQNEFWFHRALGENITPDIIDTCESFRITSKDRVLINIRKQTYSIPLPIATSSSVLEKGRKEMKSSDKLISTLQLFETRHYHNFFITWPNGLITESVYEENSPNLSHIKQYHVTKISNLQEDMRCISLNGEVIIFKTSGIIEVLRPDSSYIKITKCEKKLIQPEGFEDIPSETSSDKSKKGKGKEKLKPKSSKTSSKSSKNALQDEDKISDLKQPEYQLVIDEFECIETNGLRQKWIKEIPTDIEKLLIRTATEFNLREVFSKRMDGTNILLNKDGVQVVTFPDKTRIITTYVIEDEEIYPEWTDEEREYFDMYESDTQETDTKSKVSVSQKSSVSGMSYQSKKVIEEEEIKEYVRTDGYISVQITFNIEHANFATVAVNKLNGKISIDSPNGTCVVVDEHNNYDISLDESTSASFDGENLIIQQETCPDCQSNITCKVKIKSDDESSVTKVHQHWLTMKDSFSNKIVVNEEGNISRSRSESKDSLEVIEDEVVNGSKMAHSFNDKSEVSMIAHGKCNDMYSARSIKFFVLRRDLGCSELVHRRLLEEYKQLCRWLPWCSVNNYDTFGGNRSIVSILTPIHLTETEKWLMDSKLADKPAYLAYKDLKKDPGKGFYHWMRPFGRFEPKPMKPVNVLPPRLPRAYVLRTLEQQWKEQTRNKWRGAKELVSAILRYRRIMESDSETILNVPIIDPRAEDERDIDDIVQAIAHRTYEDLKQRLADDVKSRMNLDITTKPLPVPEELSVEGEGDEDAVDEQKARDEERESLIRDLEAADEMSPNLKAYWRRRAEELKEEEFYKNLLREGTVPPYFRNVLGGAIWWEMNNAAGEAVTKAERRKMKCQCNNMEEASAKTKTETSEPTFFPE